MCGQCYLVNVCVCVMDRRQIDGSNAAAVMRVPKYRAHPYNFPFFFIFYIIGPFAGALTNLHAIESVRA